MKMNVSTQTLLSEEVIDFLLHNYIVTSNGCKAQSTMTEYLSSEDIINNIIPKRVKRDYVSNLPLEVIIGISKYLTIHQFYTLSKTCKNLYIHYKTPVIWDYYLNLDYKKHLPYVTPTTDLYEKYRELATRTLLPRDCAIANLGRSWRYDGEGNAILIDVCWFDLSGELNYITNGTYVVEYVIKVEQVSDGLVGLDFIAECEGSEPSVYNMTKIFYDNIRGKGWSILKCPENLIIHNPKSLYNKVKIQIVNKKCNWKYGFSLRSVTLKKINN